MSFEKKIRTNKILKKVNKKNISAPMTEKKDLKNKNFQRKNGPARPRKNWAEGLPKEDLIKMIIEGKSPLDCKFKFVLLRGINLQGKHQSKDIWAALTEVRTGDIPLIKKFTDSEATLLLIRENVCQKATDNLVAAFKDVVFCDSSEKLFEFCISKKQLILDELKRLAEMKQNFIPLVKSCKYIRKALNKTNSIPEEIMFVRKNLGEPALENKDLNYDK